MTTIEICGVMVCRACRYIFPDLAHSPLACILKSHVSRPARAIVAAVSKVRGVGQDCLLHGNRPCRISAGSVAEMADAGISVIYGNDADLVRFECTMSGSPLPEYAVIIPHYNDVMRLERCLKALVAQDLTGVEILVVDNGSDQDLFALKARFGQVQFHHQPEKGAGPARNMGVARSRAPWLLFIDADCVPAADWLAVGRRIARADTVIGGRVDIFHETPAPKTGAEAFEEVFAFRMRAYLERDAFLGAGNLITSRRVFEAVGGFRPAVSEDKDWSQRAARAGFELAFADDFVVSHPSRRTWPELRHKWRRLTREGFLLGGAGGLGARLRWMARALLMPVSILVHAPRILGARTLSSPEKIGAVVILIRLRLARMGWMIGQALGGPA